MSVILIVEDDDALRERLVTAIRARGFDASGAASVTDARAAIGNDPPELALLDLRVADGYGLDLIEALRAADPARWPALRFQHLASFLLAQDPMAHSPQAATPIHADLNARLVGPARWGRSSVRAPKRLDRRFPSRTSGSAPATDASRHRSAA